MVEDRASKNTGHHCDFLLLGNMKHEHRNRKIEFYIRCIALYYTLMHVAGNLMFSVLKRINA